MVSLNQLVAVCLLYVVGLFAVAFAAERAAARGRGDWLLRSPLVYTLSLSIYCTAWTFYGAVGYAARSGLEFVTIYLGPSLVMIGWWWVLRRLVRIGRSHRVTSVADLISSRYGKSNLLAILVTIMAVIGVTPYIALQLQSVTLSLSIFASAEPGVTPGSDPLNSAQAAFWVAVGLALFTVLFGTRNLNVNERHHGVVIAIAVEAVVKLLALLAVGVFVVWGLAGGVDQALAQIDRSALGQWQVEGGRWAALTLLAAAAFICLPRMFQVLVVENDDERHLQTASWAFPLYLMLMSLFVVPIAVVGLDLLPEGSNPDLFVLSLPLSQGQNSLAMFAFLGGFSSATSMVIVATLALSTMVSNHIVMPIWLTYGQNTVQQSGDVRHVVILSRRLSILLIISLGYFYYRLSGGGGALAAIGTISFGGVAQFLPVLLGGIFWRGATRTGAVCGLSVGFAIWVYTMLLPSFGAGAALSVATFQDGLFGMTWLRPEALFGINGLDPTVHAVIWSLSLNALVFVAVSLFSFPAPVERLQGAQFVNIFDHSTAARGWSASVAASEDLMIMAQRILGPAEAQGFFRAQAQLQEKSDGLPEPTPRFVQALERELAASVGAATAHAMVSQLVGGASVSVQDLLAVADESAQMLEYSSQLEIKSRELTDTAAKLRRANDKLTQLSHQKDSFLSQISHELRTPMTSIRSFSEILRDAQGLGPEEKTRYASIIHSETIRLTRLLDDLLDLSVLENGEVSLNRQRGSLRDVLDQAVTTARAANTRAITIDRDLPGEEVMLETDLDRLVQVFINLITNAQKYCVADDPQLSIRAHQQGPRIIVDLIDNGAGIDAASQELIFEKFSRLPGQGGEGAGLGLAICREIIKRLQGDISYLTEVSGTGFRVELPLAQNGA
ncbi:MULTISPECIES: sensor histidine kinase [unclassified Sulfitobacter]|jgi:Na+/proline symporter/nitrogen-specific signal transduction histidine kinase|uniref:sensor histidine kinase n=1 Tax=Sulfitobacter TaxID=60136 RepID=UPI000066B174|nr:MULTISPECIES: sensor histidine kinase [unclassified Sulfitobacter]AXI50872.1 sodium:solute symporter [Sulfitobacter sp. SK025]EAP80492.1 sensor histidine kinase [Sulfitobacter sp. NAS-14.1]